MIHLKRISPKRWVYWGHETIYPDYEKCGVFEPFFWVEDQHPFRIANGWRIKETPFDAFHIGIAKKSGIKTQEGALGGKPLDEFSPEEIGDWNGSVQKEEV